MGYDSERTVRKRSEMHPREVALILCIHTRVNGDEFLKRSEGRRSFTWPPPLPSNEDPVIREMGRANSKQFNGCA